MSDLVRSMVYEAAAGEVLPPSVISDALSGPDVLDYTVMTKGYSSPRIKKLTVIYKVEEEGSAQDTQPV